MIVVKTPDQIEKMRRAGVLVAQTLDLMGREAKVGVTTGELDAMAEEFICSHDAVPAFKGYQGFPATLCVSINDEVVHGIPGERRLEIGQIVSIDVGVKLDGWYSDSARTFPIGQEALALGIAEARPGNHLGDISAAVQTYAEKQGYSVVRDLVGHGIGQEMHEEPQIPNFGTAHTGPDLTEGMVLAIEPMVNVGGYRIKFDADKWTVRTTDGSLSAHFEHTIAILADGPEILTASLGDV